MKHKTGRYKLKRSLGLVELSLYGIGIILGAGIYALIGVGAGIAGNAVWLSFVIAAVIAAFTGLSYAELSSMYPKEAAEYNYTKKAFNRRFLSFTVGWLMVIASIVAAVTVAFGFAGYFTHMFGGSITMVAAVLVILLSIINYIGIKESSKFNIVSTIIETLGLVIVIVIGMYFLSYSGITIDIFETPNNAGLPVIISATALIFFAYIGYEGIVNVSEETKRAKSVVPKALVLSIIISTILYILVSFSAVNILGWQGLSSSNAPLASVVSTIIPNAGFVFSLIALFATANTALIMLIVGSRILYGMSSDSSMPRKFSVIGKTGTPYFSVVFITLAALFVTLIGNIKSVALVADASIFIVYLTVNASLIRLRYKMPDGKRTFKTPVNIGRFPVLAFLGVSTVIFMLMQVDMGIIALEIALILAGYVIFRLMPSRDNNKKIGPGVPRRKE